MAIEYHYDLYPSDDPRDGTRLVRYSADTALQAADYRDVIGVGRGRAIIGADLADDLDPEGEQYVRVVRDDGSTELVVGGWWTNTVKYEAAVRNETRRLDVGGAGTMAYLARSVMAPHTYMGAAGAGAGITTGAQDPFDRLWRLWNQGDWAGGDYLGAILWRVIMEAQSYRSGAYTHKHKDGETYTDTHLNDRLRTAIPDLVLGFDKDEDSDGNAWTLPSGQFTAQVGENVLAVVRRLMESGLYIEMDPDTFELRAWEGNDHRRDRTGGAWGAAVVRLQAPTDGTIDTGNIKSDSERLITSHIRRTTVWTGGGDDLYGIADTPGPRPWEGFVGSDASDVTVLDNLADVQLTARDEAGDVLTARLKLGATPVTGHYRPWEEVKLDDLVTVHTGTGEWDYDEATYPVGALRIHLRDGGDWDAWVDLGASYEAMAQRQFEVAALPAHSHPLNLCVPFVPGGELETGRIYFSNDDETLSGLDGGTDYAASWDHTVIAAGEPRALYSTPQSTLVNSGVGNPYTQTDAPAQTVGTDMWARRLSDLPAAVLATVQAGGSFRMAVRSKNRTGVGISSDQQNFPETIGRIYRPGTSTFIGTLFDVGDARGDYVFAESAFVVIPIEADVAAVPSAVGTDVLVLELGGDHITPTTGGTGWAYRPADSSADDLPFVVDSQADMNAWAEFTTSGESGGTGDGNVNLIGTSTRAKRCDDTEHWHDSREPTVLDDADQGMRIGTLWLDDTTGRVWWLTDNTAGAAVWILISDPTDSGSVALSDDTPLVESGAGDPGTAEDASRSDHVHPADGGGGGGGLDSGTSFPGSPSNNDLFYRTDRDLLYFYDGTRWLTVNRYHEKLGSWNNVSASSGQDSWTVPPTALGYDVWMETLYATMESSGLSGSAYWQIQFGKRDGGTSTALATVNSQSNTSSVMVQETAAINALLGSGVEAWYAALIKTSTPGNLFAAAAIAYRLVG